MTAYGEPETFFNASLASDKETCITWPFAKDYHGYGVMRADGKRVTVHRRMCVAAHGPAPSPKHEAAHLCGKGNMACCNKNHLAWKTKTENERDKRLHGTDNAGSRHGMSTLTEENVLRIRSLQGTASAESIGDLFGVGRRTVNRIHKRETWKHI